WTGASAARQSHSGSRAAPRQRRVKATAMADRPSTPEVFDRPRGRECCCAYCALRCISSLMSTVSHRNQSSAKELISRLESTNRNTDFDWELLLEANYLTLLSDRPNLGIIDVGGH